MEYEKNTGRIMTFSGKPIGFEGLPNQMVEALNIIKDRRSKRRNRKTEN